MPGVFSEPTYNTIGDPFDNRNLHVISGHAPFDHRQGPRGIMHHQPISGKHSPKAFFSTFVHMPEGGARMDRVRKDVNSDSQLEQSMRCDLLRCRLRTTVLLDLSGWRDGGLG
jgi:hypothetical protein